MVSVRLAPDKAAALIEIQRHRGITRTAALTEAITAFLYSYGYRSERPGR